MRFLFTFSMVDKQTFSYVKFIQEFVVKKRNQNIEAHLFEQSVESESYFLRN